MTTEIDSAILEHYAGDDLATQIYNAIGKPTPSLRDLAPYDEFHIGGWHATGHLFAKLEPQAGARWLDVGCGLGGAARYAADMTGAHVTGIDLSPDYIDAATMLSFLTNMAEQTVFQTGNALALPFEKESFDGAYTIHVAMNIEDKAALYAGIARVLKPGASFGIYDVLAGEGTKKIKYPVPWAATAKSSFPASLKDMQSVLKKAGFEIVETEDCSEAGLQALGRMKEIKDLPGPKMIMGGDYRLKIDNLECNLREGVCEAWQIICHAKG